MTLRDGDDAITEMSSRSTTLRLAQIRLVVVDGPDRGAAALLPTGSARIGTAPGCHFQLTDRTVSRIHCEVRVTREGVRVTDRSSTNGTSVDGVRVYEAELLAGSVLRLGGTSLRVEVAASALTVPLAPIDSFGPLIGSSPEMRAIYALIPAVAKAQSTTLILGETGTGKELVAAAIHGASARASGPFVVLDCGSVAPGVIESDLFGHVRGAFTGALSDRPGLFEAANGGTIFLDEVSELPLSLQPRLLRVLENREVRRMGANRTTSVDVQVIAAANRSLAECVNQGIFREDLFYRLSVVEVALPPLRARGDDIVALARHFWKRFAPPEISMPEGFEGVLRQRSWPGNVRELRNFVERSAKIGWANSETSATLSGAGAAASGPLAGLFHLASGDRPLQEARKEWNERFEAVYANALLEKTRGNVTQAAELAGVNRRSFQRMLARLTGEAEDPDEGAP